MGTPDTVGAPADALLESRPDRRWVGPAVLVLLASVLFIASGLIALSDRGESGSTTTAAAGTDDIDVGFATDMLDHHQQALQMALLAIDKATTTPVRTLALKMVVSQQSESGRFLQYLEERQLPQGDPDRVVMAWMGMPMPRASMPGLASPEELLALTNATGTEVDRLFLDLMIRHHEGGLHMAEHAAAHGRNGPLKDTAGRMVVMQRREIADMTQLRAGLS